MTTPKAKFAGLALIAALCAGVILGLTACTDEADFNAGVAAYKRGDYATALREWRPLAKQGNANAQFFLGVMYGKGLGRVLINESWVSGGAPMSALEPTPDVQ